MTRDLRIVLYTRITRACKLINSSRALHATFNL
jgi:hypothetical protein